MKIGLAHVAAKYTVPTGSGTQFADGCNATWTYGFRTLKVYCTADYLANYPLQSSWSSVPSTVTQLAQTTQFTSQLSRAWQTVILTVFTFANGSTNWWRVDPSKTRFDAEYAEIRVLAEYLLTTYNGTGREFILQNWEGDWAFMDAFVVNTPVDRQLVDRYAAFLGTRQRAVSDARKAVASDCRVLMAIEANRVVDLRVAPHLRRIGHEIAARVTPDVISYSAYDSTIVEQGSWGASIDAWTAATTPIFTLALRSLRLAFPGVPIMIGEFGFPEGIELPAGRSVGDMIRTVASIASAAGVKWFIYWQIFDNEETSPGVARGFYVQKPDGSTSQAGVALMGLL